MKQYSIIITIYAIICTIFLLSSFDRIYAMREFLRDNGVKYSTLAFGKDWYMTTVSEAIPLWNKNHPTWPIGEDTNVHDALRIIAEVIND